MHTARPAPRTGHGRAPVLETERLRLRAWRLDDAPAYARIVADPDVRRYLGSGLLHQARRTAASLGATSRGEARRTIQQLTAHWRRCGFGAWAVEEKATGALIGQIGLLHHPDWFADTANVEVGWVLARGAWGRGFATEGGRASIAWAFDRLALERIVSITRTGNRRSRRVMERLGLSFEGRTRWKGCDVVWYAADREAWVRPPAGGGPAVEPQGLGPQASWASGARGTASAGIVSQRFPSPRRAG